MQSKRAKVLILVVLLAVWVLVFVLRRPSEAPVPSGPAQTGARTSRAAPGSGGVPRLRTDLLNVPRAPYPSEVQNIFSGPPPPPPPGQAGLSGGPAAAPPPPPPDPFQEEAKQFRYIGFLQSDGSATAFIVRGQEVYTVPIGELVSGRFRVLEVRDDSVLLGSPGGDKQVRLSLAAEAGATPRTAEIIVPPRTPVNPGPPQAPGAASPPRPDPRIILGPAPRPNAP
jgi:hypothetical protein